MVLKKLLRRLGVGGPSVDTVLPRPDTQPGRSLAGQVNLVGGDHDVAIEELSLALVTQVETESGGSEFNSAVEFARLVVAGNFTLAHGEERSIPFELPVPWETPITSVYGQPLRGMAMGVRTDLAVAKAVDKGDLDRVNVHPLASQEAVLDAFAKLGFGFKSADLERGRIHGVRQELPFYQEIEYFPPRRHAGNLTEVELTFVADAQGMDVVLEADKRAGWHSPGGDAFGRFRVSHDEAENLDWAARLDSWLNEVARRPAHHGGHHGHHGHGGRGVGAGGMIAGAAGGLVAGMVIGDMMDGFDGMDDFGGGE